MSPIRTPKIADTPSRIGNVFDTLCVSCNYGSELCQGNRHSSVSSRDKSKCCRCMHGRHAGCESSAVLAFNKAHQVIGSRGYADNDNLLNTNVYRTLNLWPFSFLCRGCIKVKYHLSKRSSFAFLRVDRGGQNQDFATRKFESVMVTPLVKRAVVKKRLKRFKRVQSDRIITVPVSKQAQ